MVQDLIRKFFDWILVRCLGIRIAGLKTILKKWCVILGPEYLRRFAVLFLLTIILAVTEVIGVTVILPLMTSLVAPEQLLQNPWGKKLFAISGAKDLNSLIFLGCSIFFAIFLLRNILAIFLNYMQCRFTFDCQVYLSSRVLSGYLDRNYEFFLSRNSAVLLKNVTMETSYFASNVILHSLQFISNFFVTLIICLFLIVFNPWMALIAAVAATGLFGFIYFGLRRHLVPWARQRNAYYSEMNRLSHQALSGIKEIKVLGCENEYISQFHIQSARFGNISTWYQTVNSNTRFIVELTATGSILLIIMSTAYFNLPLTKYIPYMAMYFAALNRILPSANNMFSSIVTIRYFWYSFHNVYDALESGYPFNNRLQPPVNTPSIQTELPPLNHAIVFEHVGYRYPEREENVLHDIHIEIPCGARVAVVGSSGAGKTTIIDLLLALLKPTQGVIRVDGQPLTETNQRSWQKQLGYVSQQVFLADASLQENIAFGIRASEIDPERIRESVHQAQLDQFVADLPQGYQTSIGERGLRISGGERQRIGIARALYRRPRVLILDEATSALDPITESEINKAVTSLCEGITVIIITHRLNSVRCCDRLFFLEKGRLAGSGTYDELTAACPAFAEMDQVMLK